MDKALPIPATPEDGLKFLIDKVTILREENRAIFEGPKNMHPIIRELIKRKDSRKLSIRSLARLTNLSPTTVFRLVSGTFQPTEEEISNIAIFLAGNRPESRPNKRRGRRDPYLPKAKRVEYLTKRIQKLLDELSQLVSSP